MTRRLGSVIIVLCVGLTSTANGAPGGSGVVKPGSQIQPIHHPVPTLAFNLTCRAAWPPGQIIYRVGVENEGPGTVPVGTKIHWNIDIHPGGTWSGDYTFSAALAPHNHVWMNAGGFPLSFQDSTCTVNVLP